jgi:hypothetical protein
VNATDYKAREAQLKDCRAWLGPNQPGVTTPDPTAAPGETTGPPASGDDNPSSARAGVSPDKGAPGGGSGGGAGRGSAGRGGGTQLDQVPPQIRAEIERVLDELESRNETRTPDAGGLLDFLLAP